MADRIVNPAAHQRLIAKRARQKQQIGELQASLTAAQQRIQELEQALAEREQELDDVRRDWKPSPFFLPVLKNPVLSHSHG